MFRLVLRCSGGMNIIILSSDPSPISSTIRVVLVVGIAGTSPYKLC